MPWRHGFLILYTVGRTPWTGDQPVSGPLPTHRTTQTQNKLTQTSMHWVEFEPTVPAFERSKTVHALDRATTVIGISTRLHGVILQKIVLFIITTTRISNLAHYSLILLSFDATQTSLSYWARRWMNHKLWNSFGFVSLYSFFLSIFVWLLQIGERPFFIHFHLGSTDWRETWLIVKHFTGIWNIH
jgi:hypothetical protein